MLAIPELYEYSSRVRRRFVAKLSELPWEKVIENREASFYSMRNILVHITDNEDWIVNWVIRDDPAGYRRARKAEEYGSMITIKEHLEEVERKTRDYLEVADEEELRRVVKFTLSSGKTFDLSVEESLFQSFTEQLYHLGELIALLWQEDVEPPTMQWFWNNPRAKA